MNYNNNAYSVLNGAITNVATAITLATGTGSRFPASDFRVTLVGYDGSGNENAWEICHCTSRTGDILTVTRGQEGTTAVAWANASRIEQRITAGVMASIDVAPGTTAQYWRGDKSWRDFFTDVRAATLTGLSTATNAVITAADTVLGALGKLQAQITGITSVNGLLKSNGTTVSAAVAGTDYVSPSSTETQTNKTLTNPVINGATGDTSVLNFGSGQFYKDTSGNVGIGTSTPGSLYATEHILAMVRSQNAATRMTLVNATVGLSAVAVFKLIGGTTNSFVDIGLADNNGAPYAVFTTGSAVQRVTFNINGTERFLITSGGRIQSNGPVDSNIVAMAALDVDCSAGNYFTKTIAGASTFTFSNVPASRAFSFTLELTHTSGTVTWPASVQWPGGTAPTLTTGKTHLFTFVTDDGGTRWRGASSVNYTN